MDELVNRIVRLFGQSKITTDPSTTDYGIIKNAIIEEWPYFLAEHLIPNDSSMFQVDKLRSLVMTKTTTLNRQVKYSEKGSTNLFYKYDLPTDLVCMLQLGRDGDELNYRKFINSYGGIEANYYEITGGLGRNKYMLYGGSDTNIFFIPVIQYGASYILSPAHYDQLELEYISKDPEFIVKSPDIRVKNAFTYFVADKLIGQFKPSIPGWIETMKRDLAIHTTNLKNMIS